MDATPETAALSRLMQSAADDRTALFADIVSAVREHLGADISYLGEFVDGHQVVRSGVGVREGTALPQESTYCHHVVRGELPSIIADARQDPRVRNLPTTQQLNIGSYVGVPVTLPSGRVFGALCSISHEPDPSLRQRDVRFLQVLADVVGAHLGRQETAAADATAKKRRVRAVLDSGQMDVVFQPIVDLRTGATIGAEALARFTAQPAQPPDRWFADAWDAKLGVELEVLAIRKALMQLPRLPAGLYLSVNASPATLRSVAFAEALSGAAVERVLVEITEHALIENYAALESAVAMARKVGLRIAIDDVGIGYSGLHHILRVAPQVLKLDMSLTQGLHADPAKRAMTSAAVYFAKRTNTMLVAEGVETREDAETLRVLEVPCGQGYYFGKPGPLPSLQPGHPAAQRRA